ncbi:hypothetical protein I4U23_015122 [Adineta vaga]|nr:hypothetical protein I4U23_015122 [Adineta vaga]
MYATMQSILAARSTFVQVSSIILLIFGNIGEILNIIIFVQRSFRTNSCAIYFLAASCARLIFIDFTILLNDLSMGYDIDPARDSIGFCKVKWYISCVTTILPVSFIVLACIDRLTLSSLSLRRLGWSQPRFAYRLIAGVSLFWLIFSIHAIIGGTVLSEPGFSMCYIQPGAYTYFMTTYSVVINYLLPPILMMIFGLLTIINVRRTQRQIHPMTNPGYAQRKDLLLLRMLLFQVLINVIFIIPASAYQIYQIVSANWTKTPLQQAWDLLYFSLALALFYIPYLETITSYHINRKYI